MAASLIVPPSAHALDQDDNWVTLETDIYGADQVNRFRLRVTDASQPVPGHFLRLTWGDRTVELTFSATPNNTGLQISSRGAGEDSDTYRERLAEELRSVAEIAQDMSVGVVGEDIHLTLISTEPMELDSSNISTIVILADNAIASNDYPNLSAVLHVYVEGQADPLMRLRASYDRERRATFNLGNILGLSLGLPDTARLRSIVPGQYDYAVQYPEGATHWHFRYADEYGRPPRAERLRRSADLVAVAGGSAGDSPRRWASGARSQLCHAYLTPGDQQFYKPVHPEQPDWMYYYTAGRVLIGTTAAPWIVVSYTDGTTEERQVATSTPFAVEPDTLYCLPCGPLQSGVFSEDPRTAHSYRFELRRSGSGAVLAALYFRLIDDTASWPAVYLAYTNGAGGIESVAMRGKHEGTYRATRQQFRRARTQVQQLTPGRRSPSIAAAAKPVGVERGEIVPFGEEGLAQWRLRSGYYPREYVDHLRQLMLGDVWICDTRRQVFIAVTVDQASLALTQDDDDLHAMEITITMATPDRNAHRL